jgi:hypothetical protein
VLTTSKPLRRPIASHLHLLPSAGLRHSSGMSTFLRALRAVLWSFIGLGGRRADAEERTRQIGLLPLLAVALVLALLLIVGLVMLAKFAAQG